MARASKGRAGSGDLAERIEERLREVERDTAEKMAAACDSSREELLALVGSLRATIEDLASAVRSEEGRPEPEAPTSPIADELRPLLREVTESMDARLREIADLVALRDGGDEEEALVRALSGRGFDRIAFVDRPEHRGSRITAVVEARRAGMTYKGRVALEGGEIVAEELSPMHRMFP